MARKQVDRTLPSLEAACGPFSRFSPEINRQAFVLARLREAATTLQRKYTQPFYAMRDVARFFNIPLRTVSIAYEKLELEGLLNRLRGSKTLLVGKTISPSKPVRAVIGIPLWMHAIVVSPYSRVLHWVLEERLRQCGFVADIIFFRDSEVSSPDFTARLVQHNLDYIIWHTPPPEAMQAVLSLRDHGVRPILIQSADNPISLKVPTYLQNWKPAYDEMALDWVRLGIRTVIVPKPAHLPSQKAMQSFSAILTSHGLRVDFVKGEALVIKKAVLKHPGSTCAVAFLDQLGADGICSEEPMIIAEIVQHCRIAFCRGPIRCPYFAHRNASADLVGFSGVEMATIITNDIRDQNLPTDQPHIVLARYQPQVPFQNNVELL